MWRPESLRMAAIFEPVTPCSFWGRWICHKRISADPPWQAPPPIHRPLHQRAAWPVAPEVGPQEGPLVMYYDGYLVTRGLGPKYINMSRLKIATMINLWKKRKNDLWSYPKQHILQCMHNNHPHPDMSISTSEKTEKTHHWCIVVVSASPNMFGHSIWH